MKNVAFIVSTPFTINSFMVNHINELSKCYKVTVIANKNLGELRSDLPVDFIHLPISRNISPFNDMLCIIILIDILRRHKFDVVHTITPKAGLIGMVASFFCRINSRFHTFTGQVWATKRGLFRWILKSIDKLIFTLSTYVLVDSPSQREFLIDKKIINRNKSAVLGFGSISGVDLEKFSYSAEAYKEIREKYDIPNDAYVFTFLGRLCKDKGIDELVDAFEKVSTTTPNLYLLLVGPNENKYDKSYFQNRGNGRIVIAGATNYPERFFSASNSLILPSYREGFGTTVLEAASCGIPTIASNIYGLSDAVVDGKTGLLHEVRNVDALAVCMRKISDNQNLNSQLGLEAKKRVTKYFSSKYLTNELLKFYEENCCD